MSGAKLISVVIPAQDEQANIGQLVIEICQALQGKTPYKEVMVDDGSSDNTVGELLPTGERLGCATKAIRHEKSTALHTGISQASGSLIANGQNDPADMPAMLALRYGLHGDDFCITGYRKYRNDTAWKRLQSRLANGTRNAILNYGVFATGCGLKLFPKATFLKLPYFDHMHRYIPAPVRRHGGEVHVVVANHREHMKGVSKYTAWNRVWVGIVDIFGVIWLNSRTRLPKVVKTETTQAK